MSTEMYVRIEVQGLGSKDAYEFLSRLYVAPIINELNGSEDDEGYKWFIAEFEANCSGEASPKKRFAERKKMFNDFSTEVEIVEESISEKYYI